MIHRNISVILLLLAAVLGGVTAPATAHHSFAMFEKKKVATVEGVVKQFAWTNPHVLIDIDVPDEQGGTTRYRIESASINILVHQGWKKNAIKPGDRVTLVFNPLKNGLSGGLLVQVTLANGTVLQG
jgi:hypothetical protein